MSLRAHRVATAAYDRVNVRSREVPRAEQKKYGAIAHKLPGLILQNGLAQATGFLLAKGANRDADHHCLLLDDLNAVLVAGGVVATGDRKALHQIIIAADLHQTLRYTRAALEASAWLKRYVQGVMRVGATGEDAESDGVE